MDDERLRLVILVGAAREGRFGLAAAEWLAARARLRQEFEVDVIDLATAWLPDLMTADPAVPRPSAVRDLSPWLAAADAFAVVTQEYRFGYPASLKNAIDWYDSEWHAKPVGFLCYGGASGGLCAVAQLRQVFAESHAVTVPEAVSFHDCQERWGPDGRFADTEACRADAVAMLDRLGWWARALRRARACEPYGHPNPMYGKE
ncbi:NADPH-dependent FMN reductase [Streptomyces sp. GC420]|uniref:NADPH-dependent FMN reductase n=1 Tax=Streptomyces sp. GC420 TaxID=2697568 RepID=UPI001414E2E0|nr:NAD(P)H-dependent oxidoreductase [Streptomyces sp. GC420]NBM16041.1 NADPH-dependent oxidoreductase [Streptomyces sp. GC420]